MFAFPFRGAFASPVPTSLPQSGGSSALSLQVMCPWALLGVRLCVFSYRSDLEETFSLSPHAYASLLENLEEVLLLWLESESKGGLNLTPESFFNWEENVADISRRLETLRDTPVLKAKPLLLHLDVAAMYPNIILTHRLQPPSIKTPQQCRECPWFDQGSSCSPVPEHNRINAD